MEAALVEIICGLLCSDNEKIRQSTAALAKAYENPEALLGFCKIIVSPMETQIRQFAAVLLNKRLGKLRHWQVLNAEQQNTIKQIVLQALVTEKEKGVKNAIAQLIGSLVRHESDKQDSWLSELLKFIFDRCVMPDPKESELGSSIFATLTDSAPDQFVAHMDTICMIFASVLVSAENNGDMTTPTVCNMLAGMNYLMPFVAGHTTAENTVSKVLPQILKSLHAFAYKGVVQEFLTVFDVLDCIAEYTPKLLNNVKPVLDFCLEVANNTQLEDAIRVQVIAFIGRIVRLKKRTISKQKLLEPVLVVIFNVMCCSPTGDDDDDYFANDGGSNPVTASSQTLDILALHMSPEKLIPPLLQILEEALQNPDPVRRRAAFLAMAVIAEGCSEAITHKYLEPMLNIIKGGISDQEPLVRNAAFFALGQFSEHLQPEISKYAPQILPVLYDYLGQLVNELKMGHPESKYTDRMFYALETFVENLEDKIKPDLPILMERLFEALDAKHAPRVRELALSTVSAVATAAKEDFMPYFPKMISVLQLYMLLEITDELEQVRIQAMDTLAAIARVVGKQNFLPLANDSMGFCLSILENGADDPDLRRAVYNLMGALSIVANEDMATVYPKIMDRIVESVISSEDVLPSVGSAEDNDPNIEINLEEESEGEEDESELEGFQVENDYLIEKEEAILALKEFAANSGTAFAPYLQSAFENVYKVIDHPHDSIRRASVETIAEFVKSLHKIGDTDGVSRASLIVIPKFAQMVRSDEEQGVVLVVLDALGDLFKEVKGPAVPTAEIGELMCGLIKDLLNNKMACQFSEPGGAGGGDEEDADDSEYDDAVIENAANLLPLLGHALEPKDFSLFFGRLYPFYIQKMSKKHSNTEIRSFLFGTLADCFQSLGIWSVSYFDTMRQLFMSGITDSDPRTRQNAYYGLGELVLNSEQKSYESYPAILQALSDAIAKEKDPSALDNICGAVARLIITNLEGVPLTHVLPVFMSNLPLREDTEENDSVQKAFRVLFMKSRPIIEPYLEQMLALTIQMLYKKELTDVERTENSITFVKEVGKCYPDKFSNVSNSSPEVFQFVQSL
ncbi:uncharacterized protein Dana_GF23922, isoform A [Drosophila ananassae]|nr:importin-4 isoform X2 [Drosophila ananassae]EDV40456.1 uncharacterized protein Dana_GF23922, isoform A [Drosophila ananassae]